MIRLGLTGSIAMGKSTTARLFAEAGVPVHDADATVHALYSGRAAPLIEAAFPATVAGGIVDRTRLGNAVLGKPEAIARLEAAGKDGGLSPSTSPCCSKRAASTVSMP